MNLAVIGQLTVGVACSGIGGVYFLAPQWLGVYSDIDIYGVIESSTTSQSVDPVDVLAGTNSEPNEKKMQCWIESQPQNKLECKIFAWTVSDDTKNYIDVTKFTEQKTNTTSSSSTNTYYKITVSDELLWKKTSDNTLNISASIKGDTTLVAKIKPLFAYNQSSLIFEDKLPNSNKTYRIGKAKKIDITQGTDAGVAQKTAAETITKTSNKYQCSFSKSHLKACDIVDLQTTTTTADNLQTMTFTSSATTPSTIQENNFYLIKSSELNRSFYVTAEQADSLTEDKIMKIDNLTMAVVAQVKGADKLFHFA